ncbi:polymer-forming cytoskeletal protein [Desulfococcaceae bacterium HSG8]|nr:polymer-forming cytoskeletal protein [Desulfococcaceae bacterium HSG8]
MMGKKKKTDSISTFLGYGSSIEGLLEFQGTIRLDGNVKGKITSNGGTVIIGEKAVINADIIVDGAIIMGEVNGTIDAKERIEVYPPGRVIGDIQAPVISIDTGAVFNGSCDMKAQTISGKKSQDSVKKISVVEDVKRK